MNYQSVNARLQDIIYTNYFYCKNNTVMQTVAWQSSNGGLPVVCFLSLSEFLENDIVKLGLVMQEQYCVY